ncbi:hypothetical protein LCGC14_1632740 [marine sediment metagenome]|uniref:Uncharacterized protein n=1 Tax=marine sediment metagenome TaxID=412755 RepID=A0A0F9I251_9ZZZZ
MLRDIFHAVGIVILITSIVTATAAATIGPLIYHVVWSINAAAETGSAIALLIVGLLFPPLGWLHGVALLLGYTWI